MSGVGIWNWFVRDRKGVGALELVRVANGKGSLFLLYYIHSFMFFSFFFVFLLVFVNSWELPSQVWVICNCVLRDCIIYMHYIIHTHIPKY